MGKTFSFVSGALFGAAAGAIIGVALAPRSGAETRAMAADIANDAWDNMRDTYEHSAEEARAAVNDFGPMVDAKTDDLRAKVDLARERMDQLREQLNEVLHTLTPREEQVLRLRFGLEDGRQRTLEEVGQQFNITRERIRQIEAKALRKLRHPSRSKKLRDYLN